MPALSPSRKDRGPFTFICSNAQVIVNRAPDVWARNAPGLSSMLQLLPSPCGLLPVQWLGQIQSAAAAAP